MAVRLSALRAGHLLPQEDIQVQYTIAKNVHLHIRVYVFYIAVHTSSMR
jgi:hypothetical protein